MKSVDALDPRRIQRDWAFLCGTLGERRAGTAEEQQAADFIAERLVAAGCSSVRQETFPCDSLRAARATVAARQGRRWVSSPAAVLVGAPGTPGGKAVEGELVWREMPEQGRRLSPNCLRGKILMLFGPLPSDVATHRRLVAARPAAVIHVDERLPFPWTKNEGVYPHWAKTHGMPPMVTIPYTRAWEWRQAGVETVRVAVTVDLRQARSQNVIAEHPGLDPALPAIVVSAHHDTQCGNPGADDNGSGVMCVLELARVLAGHRFRRTLRFISFGTEEQLSVGSGAYVQAHRDTIRSSTGLVVNFDSVSSPLGHYELSAVGPEALARSAVRALSAGGVDVVLQREVTPFVDNFPFNWAGVPSLCFVRSNFPGGRWQHHSEHDTLANVSLDVLVDLLRGITPWIATAASQARFPYESGLPAEQRAAARRLGRDLFGW